MVPSALLQCGRDRRSREAAEYSGAADARQWRGIRKNAYGGAGYGPEDFPMLRADHAGIGGYRVEVIGHCPGVLDAGKGLRVRLDEELARSSRTAGLRWAFGSPVRCRSSIRGIALYGDRRKTRADSVTPASASLRELK
jgi:hypothetical protein